MTLNFKWLFSALFFLLLLSNEGYSQTGQSRTLSNSFVIHGKLTDDQLKFYTKSIEAADFEQFRCKEQTITLKFKNGFELELLSAKDLTVKNKVQGIDFNKYSDPVANPGYVYPLFEIHETGFITAEVQSISK
jgi:hypothetical protein